MGYWQGYGGDPPTTLDHHGADLCVMRIGLELHGAREDQSELGHVEQRLVVVQPEIVIGDAHLMEGDLLGVLEEAVRTPDAVQPVHIQDAVLFAHILGQPQARITPALCKENVRHIGLPEESF